MSNNGVVNIVKGATDELKVKSTHYLLGAASLVTALTWNEAIKEYANSVYPKDTGGNLNFKLAYAMVLTLIVVLLVLSLPDTTKELPKGTQDKIDDLREKELLKDKIAVLQGEVDILKQVCVLKPIPQFMQNRI